MPQAKRAGATETDERSKSGQVWAATTGLRKAGKERSHDNALGHKGRKASKLEEEEEK